MVKEIGSLSGVSERTASVYKEETAFLLKPRVVESFNHKKHFLLSKGRYNKLLLLSFMLHSKHFDK